MAGKGPLNYTTKVEADKTAGECTGMLAQHGAGRVAIDYDAERLPSGLSFEIRTPVGIRVYELPVNLSGTQKMLDQAYQKGRVERRHTSPEHARRVAWRVMKDWLEAQLALIEAGMAELSEVMLPWMMTKPGITMYGAWVESERAALESGR